MLRLLPRAVAALCAADGEETSAAKAELEKGVLLSASKVDLEPIKELGLLSAKPFIFVFNVDEAILTDESRRAELAVLVTSDGAQPTACGS